MDDKTKAKYKLHFHKMKSCPYCGNEFLKVHDLTMASDDSYATRYILCNPDILIGCGKGWTEYWHMTDVEAD